MTAADRLAEIEARIEAGTEGPWEFQPRRGFQSLSDNPGTIGFTDSAGYFVMMREGTWATEADMTLVAHARTDLPATVKALRAVLELIEDDVAFGDLSGSLAEAIEARPAAYHSSVGVVAVQRCYASGIAALATRLVRDRLRAAITEALGGAE